MLALPRKPFCNISTLFIFAIFFLDIHLILWIISIRLFAFLVRPFIGVAEQRVKTRRRVFFCSRTAFPFMLVKPSKSLYKNIHPKNTKKSSENSELLVYLSGFEPLTLRVGVSRSIQLGYRYIKIATNALITPQ